jgi:hypothetical protein
MRLIKYSYTTTTREADSDDSWDRDDTATTWAVEGLKWEEGDAFAIGDVLYATYVIYSTGDSFGHDEDHYCKLICVNKDKDIAYKNRDRVGSADNYRFYVEEDNGEQLDCYASWNGYFESLSSVITEELVVE